MTIHDFTMSFDYDSISPPNNVSGMAAHSWSQCLLIVKYANPIYTMNPLPKTHLAIEKVLLSTKHEAKFLEKLVRWT